MKSYIPYDRVPDFYRENEACLETTCAIIAENQETGVAVCVTKASGQPAIAVFRNGEQIKLAYPTGCDGIDDVAMEMSIQYLIEPEDDDLTGSGEIRYTVVDDDDDDDVRIYEDEDDAPDYPEVEEDCREPMDLKDCSPHYIDTVYDVTYVRDDEINGAVHDLLNELMEGGFSLNGEVSMELVAEVREHILQYLASEHKISVWAPRVIEAEGGEFLDPYPYDAYLTNSEEGETT